MLLEEAEGALWTPAHAGGGAGGRRCRRLSRIVVAVDPPVTGHDASDECGIVVVGAITEGPPQEWRAVVLEDASVRAASPEGWARGGDGGDASGTGRTGWWPR